MIKAFIVSDKNNRSQKIKKSIEKENNLSTLKKSNFIIVIGGDGFMLQTLKKFYKYKKPFYGINSGDYGFLMNKFSKKQTIKNFTKSKTVSINPLQLKVVNNVGKITKSLAINEVSILRQSRQAASIKISSGSKQLIKKLIAEGFSFYSSREYSL